MAKKKLPIPSLTQYVNNELLLHRNEMKGITRGTFAERDASRKEFADACANDPSLVAERAQWLLNGSYGKGSHIEVWRTIFEQFGEHKPRILSNPYKKSVVLQTILNILASLEWQSDLGYYMVTKNPNGGFINARMQELVWDEVVNACNSDTNPFTWDDSPEYKHT